ncbi:hypothetical protein BT96DRAFT_922302 [Gymnopus androsaceus JB14]|uniref:Uncharacterized protein n=1 Tax=Gymnopus androsaceus JB14 TaxID=1447944 RepID=A0A6A4HGA1_9AGAR|nr:hypothetical protein BT96DRAFT_922302 [Gymnopus androsaceus JB14]
MATYSLGALIYLIVILSLFSVFLKHGLSISSYVDAVGHLSLQLVLIVSTGYSSING